jgi:hypothetical protein
MIPATVSTAPATRSLAPRRVRTDWARRISPMTANSAPVRIHLRIRLVRRCRANLGAPYPPAGPPDEPRTTRFCRCDRSLMHLAALCVPMVRRCGPTGTPRWRLRHTTRGNVTGWPDAGTRTRSFPWPGRDDIFQTQADAA